MIAAISLLPVFVIWVVSKLPPTSKTESYDNNDNSN